MVIALVHYKSHTALVLAQTATPNNCAYLLHRLLIVFSYTMEQAMGTLEKTLLVLCLAAVVISTTEGRLTVVCYHTHA